MSFKEYEDFSAGPLRLPIRGKTYEIAEVSYEAGLRMQQVQAGTAPEMSADDQWRLLMGVAYDEMVADNVPALALERAILTCLTDYRLGREMAEKVWEVGVDPEALAPKGAAKDEDSTGTDVESSTPSPVSTTGTTSPKTSTKRKAPKAAPSQKSSPTST